MESVATADMLRSVTLNVLSALQLASHHVSDSGALIDGARFDYIIVGGGTAGCVLANRLTENPNITVALLETGAQQPIESVLPGTYALMPGTAYDYNFVTEQDYYTAQLLEDKVPKITAGKMISGTSGLDSLLNIRSNRRDFDRWVDASRDSSWGYDQMLKYYIKSERLEDQGILDSEDADQHGKDGPIGLSRQSFPINEDIIKAFKELGVEDLKDINGNHNLGIAEPILRVSKGIRQSTSEAYLVPVQDRENLQVYTLTTATRVLFDQYNNAIGVQAINADNDTVSITARKEVLISAGVTKSAQLLLLSGIGYRDILRTWSIKHIAELPVGQGVRDQVGAVVAYKLKPSEKAVEDLDPKKYPVPVTVAMKALSPSAKYPDYQIVNMYFPRNSSYLVPVCSNEFKYVDGVCNRFIAANQESDLLFSVITNLYPTSVGQVALGSSRAEAAPWVYMGTFKQSRDVDNLGKYIQDFAEIAKTEWFRKAEGKLVEMDLDYCNSIRRNTYDYWRCYGRSMSVLRKHTSGTCAMGPVLRANLAVHDVQRLRVVDAASMPTLNSGDITLDIIALAERAADIIKSEQ